MEEKGQVIENILSATSTVLIAQIKGLLYIQYKINKLLAFLASIKHQLLRSEALLTYTPYHNLFKLTYKYSLISLKALNDFITFYEFARSKLHIKFNEIVTI